MAEFGLTIEQADRAVEQDPARGWPHRKIRRMRSFERTVRRIHDATENEHIDPPTGPDAELVYRLRRERRTREGKERLRAEKRRREQKGLGGGDQ